MTELPTTDAEASRRYLDNNGVRCPFCGSDQIEGRHVEVNEGRATQEVTCLECHCDWHDVYRLIGITTEASDTPGPLPPGEENDNRPRVLLVMDGGIIQAAFSTAPVDVTVRDFDVEGMQDDLCERGQLFRVDGDLAAELQPWIQPWTDLVTQPFAEKMTPETLEAFWNG